jgi:4-amino-4-deoxy-L-arabinose transferase-like glycosyltransferase
MSSRTVTLVIVAALGAAALVLGSYRIADVPGAKTIAATDIDAEARRLRQTGANTSGDAVPLFFPTEAYPPGREPLPVYAAAMALMLFGHSKASVQVPTVILGAVNVMLMYLVARRLFGKHLVALSAGVFLLLSPVHVIYARSGDNALYPVPFLLAWLWCLPTLLRQPTAGGVVLVGVLLGIGTYTHPSALVFMPILLFLTGSIISRDTRRVTLVACLAAGFFVTLSGWLLWALWHGDRIAALAAHYRLYDANLNVFQGGRDLASYFGLSVRSYVYWQYFSPSVLIFVGEPVMINATPQIGLLLWPAAVVIAAGVSWMCVRRSVLDLVLAGAILGAPIAAALEPSAISVRRTLVLLPLIVLVAAIGVDAMVQRVGTRAIAAITIAVVTVFAVFYVRYLSEAQFDAALNARCIDTLRGGFARWVQERARTSIEDRTSWLPRPRYHEQILAKRSAVFRGSLKAAERLDRRR